jgi:hypothetical protein
MLQSLLGQTIFHKLMVEAVHIYLKEADFNVSIALDDWNFTISFFESVALNRKWLANYEMLRETLRANAIVSIIWTKYDSYYLTRNLGAYLHEYRNERHLIVLDDDVTFRPKYLSKFVKAFQKSGRTRGFEWFGGGIIIPFDKWSTVIPFVEFVFRSVTFLVHQVRPCKSLLIWDEQLIYGTLWVRGKRYSAVAPQRWPRGMQHIQFGVGLAESRALMPKTSVLPRCQLGLDRGVRSKVTPYLSKTLSRLYDSNTTYLMPDVVRTIKTQLLPKWVDEVSKSASWRANLSAPTTRP